MPEDTTPDTGAEATPSDTDTDTSDDTTPSTDFEAEAKKWKALARKHEQQAKSNAAAAKRVSDLENANKSEAEKLADKAAAAEERANTAELKALRLEVAHDKGLTPGQAKRLVGATREELEADADELLETFGAKATDKATENGDGDRRRPKENLRPGASSEEDQPISREQANKLAASIESGGF